MKRIIAACVVTALLASCGGEESTAPETTGSKPAAKEAGAGESMTAAPSADAAKVADPAYGLDRLKMAVASFSVDDLKVAAGKLSESIMSQAGSSATLKEKLAKLSPTDVTAMAELKKSVSSAETMVKDLREKLEVVVEKMKEKGIDVAQYAGFLKTG